MEIETIWISMGQFSLFLPWSHWWVNDIYFFNFFLSYFWVLNNQLGNGAVIPWLSPSTSSTFSFCFFSILLSSCHYIHEEMKGQRSRVLLIYIPAAFYTADAKWSQAAFIWIHSVSLQCTPLPCSTLQSKFCLITTKTTPIKKKMPHLHHTGAVTINLGKHKGSSFICIPLIRSKDLKIKND